MFLKDLPAQVVVLLQYLIVGGSFLFSFLVLLGTVGRVVPAKVLLPEVHGHVRVEVHVFGVSHVHLVSVLLKSYSRENTDKFLIL